MLHAIVGELQLSLQTMTIDADDGLGMAREATEPVSPTQQALNLLGQLERRTQRLRVHRPPAVFAGDGSAAQAELLGRLPAATGGRRHLSPVGLAEPVQRLLARRPFFCGGQQKRQAGVCP